MAECHCQYCLQKSTHLEVGGQLAVDGEDEQLRHGAAGGRQLLQALLQREAAGLDLLLARHEDQDVALRVACGAAMVVLALLQRTHSKWTVDVLQSCHSSPWLANIQAAQSSGHRERPVSLACDTALSNQHSPHPAAPEGTPCIMGRTEVDGDGLLDGGLHVVLLRRLAEQDVDREGAPGDLEHRRAGEEVGELGGVQRRRRHDQLEVPPPRHHLPASTACC